MPTESGQQKDKKSRPAAGKSGKEEAKESGMKPHDLTRGKAGGKLGQSTTKRTAPMGKPAGGGRPVAAGKRLLPKAVPTEEEITTKAAALSGPAAAAFGSIVTGLAEHLGSPEAARLWLVTPSPQFNTTPLDAILAGEAENVLAYLESRWGPGPVYA